jgi:hypothetical protein
MLQSDAPSTRMMMPLVYRRNPTKNAAMAQQMADDMMMLFLRESWGRFGGKGGGPGGGGGVVCVSLMMSRDGAVRCLTASA